MLHKGANEVCTLIASHEQLISYVSVKLKGSVLFSFFFLISQMSPKWFHLNNQWFINIFCTHNNSLTALGTYYMPGAWQCQALDQFSSSKEAKGSPHCMHGAQQWPRCHAQGWHWAGSSTTALPCSSPWLRAHCLSHSNSYTGWWYQNCTPCVVILKP